MRTTGVLPNALVGLLILLSAGAIVLSLVNSPQVAQTQLQTASKNLKAAPSFVFVDSVTIHEPTPSVQFGGKKSATTSQQVIYQAPDRVKVTSSAARGVTLEVIGNNRYERSGNGPWSALPPLSVTGASAGAREAQVLLSPIASMASSTSVVRSGSQFQFVPGDRVSLLNDLFGQLANSLSSVDFSAVVNGEFVSSEHVVATHAGTRFLIDFRYLRIGSAPRIVIPNLA